MSRLRTRVARLPLRVRLVAGFSAATLVVLIAAAGFVYWRVEYALDRGLDGELEQAGGTIAPLVRASGIVGDRDAADATGVDWQVIGEGGVLLDHSGPTDTDPMLGQHQLAQIGATPRTLNIGDFLPGGRAPYRVRAIETGNDQYLVVGVRRDHRDEALRELVLQLLVAGIGSLIITAFVGDRLARAALRPVERYRQQAAAIAAGAAELRLDVPDLRDDEVTRLGHTFNDMLAELERALDRERQFVSEASHELRTPITLLAGRIQLARRRRRTAEEHERILSELEIDVDRLARLADGLLALGTASPVGAAGTVATAHVEHADLAVVAARIVNQRRLVDPGHAGDVTLELLTPHASVALADLALERILTNLLDNAVRHGAAPVRVVVDRPAPGWARLLVADAGPGMPPDLLRTATQRFARATEARTRPGAGLGLSLASALVGQGGGQLRLCHGGEHVSFPSASPEGAVAIACEHGPEMTATVLLPTYSGF
ncbi:ATP-binding protein [Nocardioides ginsengisoli]|uniref:histidine kinase n=1 Tax=Nocardioides ginsengisoli TaxID=363868 RepID=A0ABW3W5G7_9ACTN